MTGSTLSNALPKQRNDIDAFIAREMHAHRELWTPLPFAEYRWEGDWEDARSDDERRRADARKRLGAYRRYVTGIESQNQSRLAELTCTAMRCLERGIHGDNELGSIGADMVQWIRIDWGTQYHGRTKDRHEVFKWAQHLTRRYDLLPGHVREMTIARHVSSEDRGELQQLFGNAEPVMVCGVRRAREAA